MTPEQHEFALALVLVPGRGRALNPDGFRARAGIAQPSEWALQELQNAIDRRDSDDAETALIVGSTFGRDHRWARPYQDLLGTDWHNFHETAAHALGFLGDSDAVLAIVQATRHVPAYLQYDDGRALASKAIHSLGKIPGPGAETALRDLLRHHDPSLSATAQRVLNRRLANQPDADRLRIIKPLDD